MIGENFLFHFPTLLDHDKADIPDLLNFDEETLIVAFVMAK